VADLEQVTRPSQSPSIRPIAAAGMRAPPAPVDPNIHTWGTAGSNVFQLTADLRNSVPPADMKEESRTYDVVRIKNPDDNQQHIDVEVMTEYKARNSIDKSRTTMRFATTTADANSEIISRGNTRNSE